MPWGVHCHVLDRSADAPAAHYTRYFTQGDPMDTETVLRFAASSDVVTIDSEHVSAEALIALEKQGKLVAPQGRVLRIIQNKCRQKEFLAAHGIPTAEFTTYASKVELQSAQVEFPAVLKKATHGYDGYGVKVLKSATDLAHAFDGELLIEKKIAIAKEIAVIVASDRESKRVAYDPVEMVFDPEKNILKYQLAPADISAADARRAQELALDVAEKLGIVGLLAVEMFLTATGEILINEMAPRPHNSGHHTIEAAVTSQYTNLVRILTGQPLGSTATTVPSMMINILGPEVGREPAFAKFIAEAMRLANAHVHDYGKKDLRPFRKLGHITLTGERRALEKQYADLDKILNS